MRHLPSARGLGFERDPLVFDLTMRNLTDLALPIELMKTDYLTGLAGLKAGADQLLVVFIAPPWGEGLSNTTGLDLRRTSPPVAEIIDGLVGRFARNPLLCAIQIFETTDPSSIDVLKPRFEWSALRMYDMNARGQNHGILIGTRGWMP